MGNVQDTMTQNVGCGGCNGRDLRDEDSLDADAQDLMATFTATFTTVGSQRKGEGRTGRMGSRRHTIDSGAALHPPPSSEQHYYGVTIVSQLENSTPRGSRYLKTSSPRETAEEEHNRLQLRVRERYDKHKELLAQDHRVSDTIETLATRAYARSDSYNQLLSRREGGSRSPVGSRHRKKAPIERIKLLTPKGKSLNDKLRDLDDFKNARRSTVSGSIMNTMAINDVDSLLLHRPGHSNTGTLAAAADDKVAATAAAVAAAAAAAVKAAAVAAGDVTGGTTEKKDTGDPDDPMYTLPLDVG